MMQTHFVCFVSLAYLTAAPLSYVKSALGEGGGAANVHVEELDE